MPSVAVDAFQVLGLDPASFDPERSLTLAEACQRILRGRGGRRLHCEVARRWVSRGCRLRGFRGDPGPLLFLPAILWSRSWHTMPEWAEAFERKRLALGQPVRVDERLLPRSPAKRLRERARANREVELLLGSKTSG